MSRSLSKVNPVTLEILSNRLWITNDEVAATLRRVSGSPVATEICDFNTALMRANGDAFMVGMYMGVISLGHDMITKDILREYSENPGIGQDDMFICADPYLGSLHQNDVALVAPIHWEGELIAWSGVAIHEVDVGGPVYGSHGSIGATSIFGEALPIPPFKIVERGVIRKDLEREYLVRSRTRDLNALDLRAKIAANNLAKRRIIECCERYGVETVVAAMEAVVDTSEEKLRRRLRLIPDGTWRHRAYMDGQPGDIHCVQLALSKEDDRLVFDFSGSGPQTDAVFNTSLAGTTGAVIGAVLPMLCYGMYSCPAAVRRVTDIVTQPGTIVDALWPAGMCKASTAAIPHVNTMATAVLGKMLASADDAELRSRSMAPWMVAATVQDLFGDDRHGRPFGATMLDPMAGGAGATAVADGIDGGGVIRAVKLRIANVETYEFRYPMLYLHRRQQIDSTGAGTRRGGVGCSIMFTVHGTGEIPGNVMHSINTQAPSSVGILGGYPGGTNSMMVVRGSNVWDVIHGGRWPTELDDIEGELEVVPGMSSSNLRSGDVYRSITCGGGGIGDPLERLPDNVAIDVFERTVSPEEAERTYGVVLADDGTADVAATADLRVRLFAERLARAEPPATGPEVDGDAGPVRSIGGHLELYAVDGETYSGCGCGHLFAPSRRNYKEGLALLEEPVQASGPTANPYHVGHDIVFRRFFCPSCGRLIEIEIARPGDPVLHDIDVRGHTEKEET
ncbi:MAG: hydantoinase B/oxoprolinase family protein [Gaiellaceae bacterium]